MRLRRITTCFMAIIMLLSVCPIMKDLGIRAEAADAPLERALFPMSVLNIVRTNTKIDADQKNYADPNGGHVWFAWDLSGSDTTLVAPFTGKVIYADKSGGHSVIIQSENKVKLANGTEDYLVCMFTHDDKLNSNIKVGNTIKRGEYFYDQGTFGDGKTGTYDRHVHIEVAVGRPSDSDKASFSKLLKYLRSNKNGRQLADVFFLAYGTTHKKDYVKVACENNRIIKFNWKTQTIVYFNTNGGSAISAYVGVQGDTFDLSGYAPTKKGYAFDGWCSDAALTKAVTALKLGEPQTVYAKWIELPPEDDPMDSFADIDAESWYSAGVGFAVRKGLMRGVSDSRFAPDGRMTRAMLVTVLYRMEGSPKVTAQTPFTDLKDAWYKDAVAWAYEQQIVNGMSAISFAPDVEITREQIATVLYRYTEYKGYGTSERADISVFPDSDSVSSWATDAIKWANAEGLINGTDKSGVAHLDPTGKATRAQVATILMRYDENIG